MSDEAGSNLDPHVVEVVMCCLVVMVMVGERSSRRRRIGVSVSYPAWRAREYDQPFGATVVISSTVTLTTWFTSLPRVARRRRRRSKAPRAARAFHQSSLFLLSLVRVILHFLRGLAKRPVETAIRLIG